MSGKRSFSFGLSQTGLKKPSPWTSEKVAYQKIFEVSGTTALRIESILRSELAITSTRKLG